MTRKTSCMLLSCYQSSKMICKTEGGTPRALKMRKLEALKVGGVQREGKKEKNTFCE